MGEVLKRAWEDTQSKHSWLSQVGIATIAGFLCWYYLSEEKAVDELTAIVIAVVAALIIWPVLEFCWNYFRAPIRILKEENQSLKEAIEKYESCAVKDLITINGNEHEGVWYGNKFVLDDPLQIVSHQSDDENFSTIFKVPCPQNSLVELRYNLRYPMISGNAAYGMGGNANLALGRPGNNRTPTLTGTGKETVRVDNHCLVEALVENRVAFDMVVDIDLISWEQHGNR